MHLVSCELSARLSVGG